MCGIIGIIGNNEVAPLLIDGLRRLNQILQQDRPLRDNVPRGFYLNIKI